jgi:hypothetical protein
VVLGTGVGDDSVGEFEAVQGDRAGVDCVGEVFAVVAGDPAVEPVELGQRRVAGCTAGGVIGVDGV